MKVCSCCLLEKENSEFGIEKSAPDGLRYWCKQCCKEYSKKYYEQIIKPKNPPKTIKRECTPGKKFCISCSTEKAVSDFYKKDTNICKECEKAAGKRRRLANPELFKQRAAASRKRRAKQIKAAAAKYRQTHAMKGYSGKKAKQYRANLTNAYVKARIRGKGIPNDLITPDMIVEMRSLIIIERIKRKLLKLGIKICDKCKNKKLLAEFYKIKHYWKGVEKIHYSNLCKVCSNQRTHQYKKKK